MTMKPLMAQINDIIAPVTKAWQSAEVVTIAIDRTGFGVDTDDELVIDVRLRLSKKPEDIEHKS